jgi:hypothetical protein
VAHQVVLLETTLVEIALLAAIKDADVITPSVIFLVNLKMLLEIGATGELLVAVLALERLFTRVNSLVPNEVANLTEGLVATIVVALVRLLLVVYPGVFLQGRVLGKSLITLSAI